MKAKPFIERTGLGPAAHVKCQASSDHMRTLETKIPPPVVMLLLGSIAWAAAQMLPVHSFDLSFHTLVAVSLTVVGLVLNISPKFAFRRAGTTVNTASVTALP